MPNGAFPADISGATSFTQPSPAGRWHRASFNEETYYNTTFDRLCSCYREYKVGKIPFSHYIHIRKRAIDMHMTKFSRQDTELREKRHDTAQNVALVVIGIFFGYSIITKSFGG